MTVVTILSGGLDSTTALAWALNAFPDHDHAAISFDYGQRHARELESARAVADHYDVPHQVVNLRGLLVGSALLGEVDVPDGKYDAPSMSATVVPGRNLLFAAAAIARTRAGGRLVTGVHAGDHPIYADCRPDFWYAVQLAARAYDVVIDTPFIERDKAYIAELGTHLDAPLGLTWSCYKGGDQHCGTCGTCVERAEAFSLAGVHDPTSYAEPSYWRSVV